MISNQKKSFLRAKIAYNYMHNLYNTTDNYLNKSISDIISEYDKHLAYLSKYDSTTLEYVYLLYQNMASSMDKCINATLKSILLKFDTQITSDHNNIDLLKMLPRKIRYLLSIQLNNYSENLELDTLNEQFMHLEKVIDNTNTIYYDLNSLFTVCDTLNYVLDMLYQPKKWYIDNKEYLNTPSGLVIKEIFYEYFKENK